MPDIRWSIPLDGQPSVRLTFVRWVTDPRDKTRWAMIERPGVRWWAVTEDEWNDLEPVPEDQE